MEEHSKTWYRQGLGPRIDALEAALKLLPGDAGAIKHVRMIAESLRTSSASYGFTEIFEAARNTEEAPNSALPQQARALVAALRSALAGQTLPRTPILLIGGSSPFMEAVRRGLEANGKEVLLTTSGAQALEQLTQGEFVFILLDLALPDQDGRQLLESLRSKPITAAIPVVVIGPKLKDETLGRRLVPEVDGYFSKPAEAKQVVVFILGRLRRAHEVTRDARRDPLTGLLNRAAFCELFDNAVKFSVSTKEPLALVLLEVGGRGLQPDAKNEEHYAAILQEVAVVLSSSFRATDLVARWSTLQFVALFPGEDQFGAMRAIEKAQQALRRRKTEADKNAITISCGLMVIQEQTTLDRALEPAEYFLYLAKTSGGNRLVCAETKIARRKDCVLIAAQPEIAALLKRILEVNGFETVLAGSNADESLQTLTRGRYRLIVIEESGPGTDGLGLLKRIRENARFNRIPIITLSAREEHAAQALDMGANDYVLKPFSPFVFISRVRHLMTRGTKPAEEARTLLLTDADLTTLIVTGTALHRNAGLQVLLARTAEDMLRRLESEEPDILLLDAHLPNGSIHLYLPQALKLADPNRTNIILTAPPQELKDLEQFAGASIRGILPKLFNLQTLIGQLGEMLNIKLEAGKADEAAAERLKQEIQNLLPGSAPAGKA
jgi:diguanylate cyclase (GGDEF)-like protein